ncbi:unnamed protein product [Rhizophagus irregularis]|nr:unnamed protein product [Rhizophagus irregularis]
MIRSVSPFSENLKTLLHSDCDPSLREYYKAGELRTSLKNSKKDLVNIDLWQTYSTKLGKMAIENRVNKCEVLTTGIHAATGAVATEFPFKDENQETIDHGSNEQHTSQSFTEEEVEREDIGELIDFYETRCLIVEGKHFEILRE